MSINQISKAAEACRAAFQAAPNARWAWCCHHSLRCEPLKESAENRIAYILAEKPEAEHATRLDNFRPVLSPMPDAVVKASVDYDKAYAAYMGYGALIDRRAPASSSLFCGTLKGWDKAWMKCKLAWRALIQTLAEHDRELAVAHDRDVPGNTWNGETIF